MHSNNQPEQISRHGTDAEGTTIYASNTAWWRTEAVTAEEALDILRNTRRDIAAAVAVLQMIGQDAAALLEADPREENAIRALDQIESALLGAKTTYFDNNLFYAFIRNGRA